MIPQEVYRKIQTLHFKTRRMASDLFAGQYVSAFKGRGMEFAEVREYYPGDDIRTIDWNVSARYGHPFVKVFHEERELTVILMLDVSGSHSFGTRGKLKRDLLAEVAGMLSFLAIKTNDKVGAMLFSSRVEKYIPPKKGAPHVWRLIKEIFTYEPQERKTDLNEALTFLNKAVKRHAIVFLISDCIDDGFEKPLRLAARKHELTVIRLTDPAETELPDAGLVNINDPETGENIIINTSKRTIRQKLAEHIFSERRKLKDILNRAGVDLVDIYTNRDVVEPLMKLFEVKGRRQ
ncbi:MAG: DUF58 domain-containing protein [Spirochaetes bacterium]|nr:DUF58 domain-containing protein [Spirochaetota bacterium]